MTSLLATALLLSTVFGYICTAYPNNYGSLCFSTEMLKGATGTCIHYHMRPMTGHKLYCQALGLSRSNKQSESYWGLIDLGVVNNLNVKLGWGERKDYPAVWCYSNDGVTDFDWSWTVGSGARCEDDAKVVLLE